MPIVLTLGALYPSFDNRFNTGGSRLRRRRGQLPRVGRVPEPRDDSLTLPGVVSTGARERRLFTATNKAEMLRPVHRPGVAEQRADNLTEDIANSRYEDYAVGEFDTGNRCLSWRRLSHAAQALQRLHVLQGSTLEWPADGGRTVRASRRRRLLPRQRQHARFSTVPGYGAYTQDRQRATGLDPRMIAPDIAVALVRADLARRTSARTALAWTDVNAGNISTFTYDQSSRLTTPQIVRGVHEAGIYNGRSPGTTRRTASSVSRAVCPPWIVCALVRLESLVLVQAILGDVRQVDADLSVRCRRHRSGWIDGLAHSPLVLPAGPTSPFPWVEFQGWGATEAPRGALMHQCTIVNGKITKYQCIVPTTWNMSPKDTRQPAWSDRAGDDRRRPTRWRVRAITNQAGGTVHDPRWRRGPAYCPVLRSVHRLRDPLATRR